MRLARAGRRDAFPVCLFGGNYLVSCYRFINVSFLLFGRAEVIEEEERDRQLFYGFFFFIYIYNFDSAHMSSGFFIFRLPV